MHRQLYQNFSMGTGMAGYGLTSLHFWCSLQESSYLQDAIEIADLLCESKHETNNGFTWDEPHGEYGVAVGLHEGSSGIAMFLLYMYCATKNKAYLEVGEGALRFDLSHGVLTDSGSLQFPAMTQGSSILYPYLENGSAGVGTALVRYFAITKRNEYLEAAEKIKLAVSQKYSVSCGLFRGLAGLGNYMLDAAEFLKDPSYLQLVERTFEGVRMFEVTRDQHLAFPGMNLTMLDTSYAHGSTGVALFVHRLVNGGPNFHFTLDQLIHALENGPMEVEKAAFMLNGVG
jgi:lantibiotic modifying enzyme